MGRRPRAPGPNFKNPWDQLQDKTRRTIDSTELSALVYVYIYIYMCVCCLSIDRLRRSPAWLIFSCREPPWLQLLLYKAPGKPSPVPVQELPRRLHRAGPAISSIQLTLRLLLKNNWIATSERVRSFHDRFVGIGVSNTSGVSNT